MSVPTQSTDQAEAFLRALALPYEGRDTAGLFFELRCRFDKGQTPTGRPPRLWIPLTDADKAASAVASLGERFGVYVSVLPRPHGKGASDDIALCGALWASVDGNDDGPAAAAAHLAARTRELSLPAPNLIAASGGGVHVAWLLEEPVDTTNADTRAKVESAARRLHRAIGGSSPQPAAETNAAYLSYLLRCPGSRNHKAAYGPGGRPVRLLRCAPDSERWPLVRWRAQLPAEPAPRRDWESRGGGGGTVWESRVPRWHREALEELRRDAAAGAPPGKRHETAVRLAAKAARLMPDPEQLEGLMETFCEATGWRAQRGEIRQIVRWASRRGSSGATAAA